MKVIIFGMSPYNTTSVSRIHRWILKELFLSGHDILSLSWGHDTSYYVPDDSGQHWYTFSTTPPRLDGPTGPVEYRIPILSLRKGLSDPVPVYEAVNQLEPDIVITIGELVEYSLMKAVKTFASKPFKWLAVLSQMQFPINNDLVDLIDYIDGVLCASTAGELEISKFFKNPCICSQFAGAEDCFRPHQQRDTEKFRLMTTGKVMQSDNLPMVMESCSILRREIPELELYVHANIHDQGEYQMESIRAKLDPRGEFIRFPDRFVSLVDGISDADLADEYSKTDIFISLPMVAGTAMSVLEAMACGCIPVLSDCPVYRDLATKIENEVDEPEFRKENILVPGIQLMTTGETYLTVSDPKELMKRIVKIYRNREKLEGYRGRLIVFSQKNSKQAFVEKLVGMTTTLQTSNEVLCLETL